MFATVRGFELQGNGASLPFRFPSPFDALGPHPLARLAAEQLQAELRSGPLFSLLEKPDAGKMFGVLVVEAPDGQLQSLRAFSGMLGGRWEWEGFVPPLFEPAEREAVEVPGEAAVKELLARSAQLDAEPEPTLAGAALEAAKMRQGEGRRLLAEQHRSNRQERERQRQTLTHFEESARRAPLHALEQESRRDKAERRRFDADAATEQAALQRALWTAERRKAALERLRRFVCRRLMQQIHDTYRIHSARGERQTLRSLYSGEPPSGAADCAAPKLLGAAQSSGSRPLAMAEFWWGATPVSGGRVSGAYYPACRNKCGPLLPFMLEGLEVEAPAVFMPPRLSGDFLETVFEDRWLVGVNKPCGLLSVPGKHRDLKDSVLERLQHRFRHSAQLQLVHRLDLDTSGLLVAAKDPETYRALQRQFAARQVEKRYIAWVEGNVSGDEGAIEWPMRVDLEDRPRQIYDPVHGRNAITRWKVLERKPGRTRLALFPLTGRTHQLRVHCAHPRGLGSPIIGDRLYGKGDPVRLLLHAEALAFLHPHTGERISLEAPAPF